jgi:tetratricopeptide (TPR) repeat protein
MKKLVFFLILLNCQNFATGQSYKDPDSLYNAGLQSYMDGQYPEAEIAFKELVNIAPTDYQSYAKLIQAYYAQKKYENASLYRKKLYEFHKKGLLKDNLSDMFCFDQFKWKGKLIQVYERFQEGDSKEIYNKHLFYIVDSKGNIEYRIQSEYSPISVELGGGKYVLCMTKGKVHSTFNISFGDDLIYDTLRQYVVEIIEDKLKPAASSRPSYGG